VVKKNRSSWTSAQKAELTKIIVLRHQHKPVLRCILPEDWIGFASKSCPVDVLGAWEGSSQKGHQLVTEIFVEK